VGAAITLHICTHMEVVCTVSAGVNTAIKMLAWEHGSTTLTGDGVTIPHPNSVQNWEDNMTTWPRITYSNICSYFMHSMAIDGKAMDNLKASEAYQYLHSNKVGCVMSYKHDHFIYLKANVEPSQCLNNAWHNAWVLVIEAGDVKTAGCTCVAGPGRSCSHSAAILWKVTRLFDHCSQGLCLFYCWYPSYIIGDLARVQCVCAMMIIIRRERCAGANETICVCVCVCVCVCEREREATLQACYFVL